MGTFPVVGVRPVAGIGARTTSAVRGPQREAAAGAGQLRDAQVGVGGFCGGGEGKEARKEEWCGEGGE